MESEATAWPELIRSVLTVVGERTRSFIDSTLPGTSWPELAPGEAADPSGARMPLRALTAELPGVSRPFAAALGRAGARAAEELLAVVEAWESGSAFDAAEAERVVEAATRLLRVIDAPEAAAQVARLVADAESAAQAAPARDGFAVAAFFASSTAPSTTPASAARAAADRRDRDAPETPKD